MKNNIEFVNLKRQYKRYKNEIDDAISEVISKNAFISGVFSKKFENNFKNMLGVDEFIATGNGTDSLYIIMKSLGIGFGDEVITTCNSWISSSETISQCGANPVFIDIDKFNTIDPEKISQKITKNTKALLIVHIHGQSCEMDSILKTCEENNILLIEDCAQSHFSEYHGNFLGTFGIASSFSFYPGKNLGAFGDAGGIATNDSELALKIRRFANHGSLYKHEHLIEGINSRMDGIQASVLDVKLKYILKNNERRLKAAKRYTDQLKDIKEIICPLIRENSKHTFHIYQIEVEGKRDELKSFLEMKDIPTVLHYPKPLPFLPCYKNLGYTFNDFPIMASKTKKILSLPICPEILDTEIDYVCNTIIDFFQKIN